MQANKIKIEFGSNCENNGFRSFEPDFLLSKEENEMSLTLFPGFCDVHVHFREPGYTYKEDIESGSNAAAHGGYTTVCTMPNLNPVQDSLEHLALQENAIKQKAKIEVLPYGALTKNEKGEVLSEMDELSSHVIAFSDDGKGVQSEKMMLQAMEKAKSLNKIVAAHCEVNELLKGGYIHAGTYALNHGHKGIVSQSEYEEIERDIFLAKKTGAKFHVCHISTKESVDLIRKAKKDGVDISCETAPHYLILDDNYLKEDGAYKMNPPLRSSLDRSALLVGILDGTIDMIATDHAPHSVQEKNLGLEKSLFGIVGIETAFPLLYTYLVKEKVITLPKLIDLLSNNPRKRFNIPQNGYSIWNLEESQTIDSSFFLSKGTSTPFFGERLISKNHITIYKNKIVYRAN